MKINKYLLFGFWLLAATVVQAGTYTTISPNSRIQVKVNNNTNGLSYSVSMDGNIIIAKSPLGLIIDNKNIGSNEMQFIGKEEAEKRQLKEKQNTVAGLPRGGFVGLIE